MAYLRSAIAERCSRRTYLPKPLSAEDEGTLSEKMTAYNVESGLSIRLVTGDAGAFSSFTATYGLFSGVRNYFIIAGRRDIPHLNELAGYYGERLVLDATVLGLGTCWVGGTYKKDACPVGDDETLVCVIAVGETPPRETLKERLLGRMVKRGGKPTDELYNAKSPPSQAFLDGMAAVRVAPSALYAQIVFFTYQDDAVTACVPDPKGRQGIDLGIALLHFELGAKTLSRFAPTDDRWGITL